MPVRKIPKNHLFVTGSFASRKNGMMGGFESLLEKEYMLLLDFDNDVDSFEEQPVNIPVPGVPRGYTPDILVRFRADPTTGIGRRPLLTEVKRSDDLVKNAEKYAPKFAAAEVFAADQGWEFSIKTETQIRTPRLANLKFLREYRNTIPEDAACDRVILALSNAGRALSVSDLLSQVCAGDDDQLYFLPIIWQMVLTHRLIMDLDVPLSNSAILHPPGEIL